MGPSYYLLTRCGQKVVAVYKFKTGDPHPNPSLNLMRFVEYDPDLNGAPVWCSIYEDSEAPYRLAKRSQQRRESNRRGDVHPDNQTHPPQG